MHRIPLFVILSLLPVVAACEGGPPPAPPGPAPRPPTSARPAGPRTAPSTAAAPTMDRDPGPPGITEDHPHLHFVEVGHDYGRRERRVKVDHTAVFYNTGPEPLEIQSIRTHCGCAAALLSAKVIDPGERGTMKMTLDTGTLSGKREKIVEVFTNDPAHPVTKYPISCLVIADVEVVPLMVILRATRSAGEVTAHFDAICLNPDLNLRIENVTTSNPGIRAEVGPLPPEAGHGKRGYRVKLVFGEEFGARNFTETVTLETNSPRDPRVTVTVVGSVREAVLATPEGLWFPRLTPGQAVTREVFVYRDDGRPLEIREVEDPSGLFEIEKERVRPDKWKLTLTLSGMAPAAPVRGSIVVHTDEPNQPVVTVGFDIPAGEGR